MPPHTHKLNGNSLGFLIAQARKAAGMQQADLANAMKTTQQTISRWEAGTVRPPMRQIGALASALGVGEATLINAAGYTTGTELSASVMSASNDRLFPVDSLSPESFERLTEYLLRAMHPDAREVRRAGKSGHTQNGIDILLVDKNGDRNTYQCKRVSRFGPNDVAVTVEKHSEPAFRKYIVLSRVASPLTSEAVRRFDGWHLWDKEDISRLIRELPDIDKRKLVNIFFPGQSYELIGAPSSGAWQTAEEFFAPFADCQATFSHSWPLIGQRTCLDTVVEKLRTKTRIVVISGAGGMGKSRLLKEVAQTICGLGFECQPLFLSPTELISAQALQMLGEMPRVLIVDDAHDRQDLAALFAFGASHKQVQILLASRHYAVAKILGEAGRFALGGHTEEVKLHRLSRLESIALAKGVLTKLGGQTDLAEPIGKATQDCPLVTVIAARLAVDGELNLALAQNNDAFRHTILGKFAKVITGELVPFGEQKSFTDVLKVASLVQPFGIEDANFRKLVSQVTGLTDDLVSSTLRILANGGIIFKRGREYRLMPDLLGDYIIEESCIDASDRLNEFAQRVFSSSPPNLLSHILVNLGRLDWRRNGGDPSKSQLLIQLWMDLKSSNEKESALEAASAAAFYQPSQAIEFVADQARQGVRSKEFSRILSHAACNLNFTLKACSLLWELGKNNDEDAQNSADHPISTLTELCKIHPNKPIEFSDTVVSFGLSLLEEHSNLSYKFTPFDFLAGILSGTGEITTSDRRSISFAPFVVNYDAVAGLRKKVIDVAFQLLEVSLPRSAIRAVQFLQAALCYPFVPFGGEISDDNRSKYEREFKTTIKRLHKVVKTTNLDPIVLIAIARAVSWHASFASNATRMPAKAVIRAMPNSLEFRTMVSLADGYGLFFFDKSDTRSWQSSTEKWIANIIKELALTHKDPTSLRHFFENCLTRISEAEFSREDSAHALLHEVLRSRPDFALELVEKAIFFPSGPFSQHFGAALFFVFRKDRSLGRYWSRRFLDHGDVGLQRAVGHAYCNPPVTEDTLAAEDADILIRVLSSSDSTVVRSGLGAISSLVKRNPLFAISLFRLTNFGSDSHLVDWALMHLQANAEQVADAFSEDDVRHILLRLRSLPELNGHWIETLLSNLSLRFPIQTCNFFLDRVSMAISERSHLSQIRPINFGPWVHKPLQFKKSPDYQEVLKLVWSWMAKHDNTDWHFEYYAATLFEGMFSPVDEQIITFLSGKLVAVSKRDLRLMAIILSHTDPEFVFNHSGFVKNFLEACDRAGAPARRKGIDALLRGSVSGLRTGKAGEPFPRDLAMVSRTEALLAHLPQLSPTYELYDLIRQHAKRSIEFQQREAEFFDED